MRQTPTPRPVPPRPVRMMILLPPAIWDELQEIAVRELRSVQGQAVALIAQGVAATPRPTARRLRRR